MSETLFKVYCPGQYKTYPHKLKIFDNGSVSNNVNYQEICKYDKSNVIITYTTQPDFFEIVNNTMVEWHDLWNLITDFSMIVYDFEILKPFIQDNNIIVNWTAAYTFDGFLGQVNN